MYLVTSNLYKMHLFTKNKGLIIIISDTVSDMTGLTLFFIVMHVIHAVTIKNSYSHVRRANMTVFYTERKYNEYIFLYIRDLLP